MPRRTSRDIRSDLVSTCCTPCLGRRDDAQRLAQSIKLSFPRRTVVTAVNELLAEGDHRGEEGAGGRADRTADRLIGMNLDRGFVVGIDVAETYAR